MSDINIKKNHTVGKARCNELADQLGAQLVDSLGGKLSRDGDVLRFKTKQAEGELRAGETDVSISIKLGLLAKAFKPKIVAEIERACAKYLHD